jgi:hypothetical protein
MVRVPGHKMMMCHESVIGKLNTNMPTEIKV